MRIPVRSPRSGLPIFPVSSSPALDVLRIGLGSGDERGRLDTDDDSRAIGPGFVGAQCALP
jgi:hypothetical protein